MNLNDDIIVSDAEKRKENPSRAWTTYMSSRQPRRPSVSTFLMEEINPSTPVFPSPRQRLPFRTPRGVTRRSTIAFILVHGADYSPRSAGLGRNVYRNAGAGNKSVNDRTTAVTGRLMGLFVPKPKRTKAGVGVIRLSTPDEV